MLLKADRPATDRSLRSHTGEAPTYIQCAVQVWGEEYTRTFVEYCLPALLAPGNLPQLAEAFPCRLTIFTTPADERRIRNSRAFTALQTVLPVEIREIPFGSTPDKYAAMSACNVEALKTASEAGGAVVFLAPDTIWSDRSLTAVTRALHHGKRAVMQAGVRVSASSVIPELDALFQRRGATAVAVSGRELVQIALDHMHPYYRAWFWDATPFNRNVPNVYWRVGNEGMVARCFHFHPLLLFPERRVSDFVSTLDDDLPLLSIRNFDAVHVVQDSDEVFHLDITEDTWGSRVHALDTLPTAAYLAAWGRMSANVFHRKFAAYPVRFHTGPLSPEWTRVERASGDVMERVFRKFDRASRRVRVVERISGIGRDQVLEMAGAGRLGWSTIPPASPHWRRFERFATGVGLGRYAEALRRRAYQRVVEWVFGVNVACRALGVDLSPRKRSLLVHGFPTLNAFLYHAYTLEHGVENPAPSIWRQLRDEPGEGLHRIRVASGLIVAHSTAIARHKYSLWLWNVRRRVRTAAKEQRRRNKLAKRRVAVAGNIARERGSKTLSRGRRRMRATTRELREGLHSARTRARRRWGKFAKRARNLRIQAPRQARAAVRRVVRFARAGVHKLRS